MAGRPPLPIGSWGEFSEPVELTPGTWMVLAKFRDADGVTRRVKRTGSTPNKAKTLLRKALVERRDAALGEEIDPDTKMSEIGERWLAEFERLVEQGTRQVTSLDQYRQQWDKRIKKAIGGLSAREFTVGRAHGFLTRVAADSPSNAKTCRTVLSGICGYATPRGAMKANPIRDAGRIEAKPKRATRGITAAEILDFHGKLVASELATRWSLPDLTTFMAATGCRIGEALAVSWDEVDFTAGTVELAHRIIRPKGRGLTRAENTKRASGDRVLGLPSWAITMLKRRKLAAKPGTVPVFPDIFGGWRDPSNTRRALRQVRESAGYEWLTSHAYRRGVATLLDSGGATARAVADQLGHAQVSMTQDRYLTRKASNDQAVAILESAVPFQ
jgi:integrase